MINTEYIKQALAELPRIESELSSAAGAADQSTYRELLRKHSSLKKLEENAERFFTLKDEVRQNRELAASESDPDLAALAESEISSLENKLAKAEKQLLQALVPPDKSDARNAIVEIRAGTGGDEAALFAGDLYRMYTRFAENKGWKTGIIDASCSETGGYKEIVFTVEGNNAYGTLKFESGGHRVQRIPQTESSGRIHTSAATVAVFPEAEAEDNIELDPNELRVDIYCSSGPGGQSVNTTYSAVRITHLPTGLVAQSQDERSQHRNKDKAMSVLKARLLDMRKQEEAERMGNTRRSLIGSGDRSQRVRTYNFPQSRLTDHRINLTMHSLDKVMDGQLDEVIGPLREHDLQERIDSELGEHLQKAEPDTAREQS